MPIIFLTSILIWMVVGPKWIVEEVPKNGNIFQEHRYVQLLNPVYSCKLIALVLFPVSTGLINML